MSVKFTRTTMYMVTMLLVAILMATFLPAVRDVAAAPVALDAAALDAYDQGFTYQGTLNDGGTPASGLYDFRFEVLAEGNIVGADVVVEDVEVTDGLFSTTVPVTGLGIWNGQVRFLRISVRADGESDFVTIGEPTEIQPAPYAFHARQASSAVEADTATTLANPGPTVIQVSAFDMIQSDGNTTLAFAAKATGRLEVTRVGAPAAFTTFAYVPVDVPAQVIGFDQRLSALTFCYSGDVDGGIGVLAGIEQAQVRQVSGFGSSTLLGEVFPSPLTDTDACQTITATTPQQVNGSLWIRFQITASAVPLEFGEIQLTFVSE